MKCKDDFEEEILDRFDIVEKVGRGRFGAVYKAYDKKLHSVCAIKRIYEVLINKSESERVYREIRILENLSPHPNILKLLNVFKSPNEKDIYLVLDFMEANLFNVIRANILTPQHIKYVTYQILKAVKYMHSAEIIHRNLKPSNILINSDCKVKVDDFSLAKCLQGEDDYPITDYVASRWYRAPEIILGAMNYGKPVDIWSVGCILGELINCKTVFPGTCTINQLSLILQLTGYPTSEDLSDIQGILTGLLHNIKTDIKKDFSVFFLISDELAIDLLKKLLQFNPKKRISVEEALDHPYFTDIRVQEEEITNEVKISLEISEKERNQIKEYKEKCLKEKEENLSKLATRVNTRISKND